MTRDDDRMAAYSSNGPTWYDGLVKPDFVAPGHFLGSEAAPNSSLFKTYPTLHKKGRSGKDVHAAVGHQHVGRRRQRRRRRPEAGQRRTLTPNLAKAVLQYTAIPMQDETARSTARCARAPAK